MYKVEEATAGRRDVYHLLNGEYLSQYFITESGNPQCCLLFWQTSLQHEATSAYIPPSPHSNSSRHLH